MSRYACVWVPHFSATAAERTEPALRERPLAIVTGAPPATRVVDASDAAREQGVVPPMTEAEARTRCPALVARTESPDRVASARQALLEAALAVSPRVEEAAAGLVHVDVGGLERLFGDEAAVGARLVRLATSVGLPPRVGVASSRIVARVAAMRSRSRVTIVAPGDERSALARAPLTVLELRPDLAATLARWGVTTLGELAALPREGLADRLGPAGLAAHDQALGRDREPFRPSTLPPFWEEALGLEWEIDTVLALAVAIERVLERLGQRLAAGHVAADELTIQLQLAAGGRYDRTVSLPYPMGSVASMLFVLRSSLEAHPPEGAVTRIALGAHVVPVRAVPRGLWEPPAPAPRDLGAALARLVALVGVENVGSPVPLATHRPDAFVLAGGLRPPAIPSKGAVEAPFEHPPGRIAPAKPALEQHADQGRLVLRRLRPPRRIEVQLGPSFDSRPSVHEGRLISAVCLDGHSWIRVVAAGGPWRVSGEWWDTQGWGRDEWDVELADGTVWLVARDLVAGDWYVDGAYD